jgi:hypothetical protein
LLRWAKIVQEIWAFLGLQFILGPVCKQLPIFSSFQLFCLIISYFYELNIFLILHFTL